MSVLLIEVVAIRISNLNITFSDLFEFVED